MREVEIYQDTYDSVDYENTVDVQEHLRTGTPAGTAEAPYGTCGASGCCNNGLYMRSTRISRIDHHSEEGRPRPRNRTVVDTREYFPAVAFLSWKQDQARLFGSDDETH